MRSWLTLAALFGLVLALGAWVYYRPARDVVVTHVLSDLNAKSVTRVRFERAPSEPPAAGAQPPSGGAPGLRAATVVTLERRAGAWHMTAPVAARADTFAVERLLSILEARSAVRYPADDLARFGMDSPIATVTLDDQAFAYGAINRTTREQYVLTRDRVYLVPLALITALPRDADALLSKQLLARDEEPVRFELPGFTVSLVEGRWTVTPAANETSADERHAWVDAWRNSAAVRATRSQRSAAADIKVELKDGRSVVFGIAQRDPELVLLRQDEKIEYHIFGDSGRRLLTPPGSPAQTPAK